MTKVLYVPLDERACNYEFPQKLAAMTGEVQLLAPPAALLGRKKQPADVEALWDWVFAQAPSCRYAILSVDTLVYGNIINSRTHHKSEEQCMALLDRFRRLKREHPALEIHAFNLVARAAAYDSAAEDPDYWADYGRKIWEYTCLKDRLARGAAEAGAEQTLQALERGIPAEILQDFLERRAVDRAVNLECVQLTAEHVFELLTVPKDDTAEYGCAAMDQRALAERIREKQLLHRVLIYPGADEAGSVLFARVYHRIRGVRPRVFVRYSSTYGPFAVPLYEDRPMNEGIGAQIHSLGGVLVDSAAESDFLLAVNSPGKEMIEAAEQGQKDLTFSTHRNLGAFFAFQRYYHETYGRPVGLADVSMANGCENECMEMARLTGSFEFLTAAGGWNTTANTVGVVLAQLSVASCCKGFAAMPEQLQLSRSFLLEHITADWLYQSNVLPQFLRETAGRIDPDALDGHTGETEAYFRAHLLQLLAEKFPEGLFGKKILLQELQTQWNGAYYIRLRMTQEALPSGAAGR